MAKGGEITRLQRENTLAGPTAILEFRDEMIVIWFVGLVEKLGTDRQNVGKINPRGDKGV